jgi:hypothetical protein
MKELLQKAGFEVSVRSNTEQSELDVLKRLLGLVLLQTPRKAERDRLLSE